MSMFGNTPPQTTDPMELFEYFMEQKRQKSLPKGEQSEGIFNKPIQDSASGALDFFTDMYDKITSKSKQAKEELQPDMEELARQSAEEAALYRMEAGIKESLRPKPTSLLSQGKSLRPQTFDDITGGLSEPEGEETLTAAPIVNFSKLDKADTEEASGAGLMAKGKEPVNVQSGKYMDQIRDAVPDELQRAVLIGTMQTEVGDRGPIEENPNYTLKGAYKVFSDAKVNRALSSLSPEEQAKVKAGKPSRALGMTIFDQNYGGGSAYRGRGLVQLTHKKNYQAVQDRLAEKGINVDLVNNPDLVNDPKYAVPVAVAYFEVAGITKDGVQSLGPATLNNIVNRGIERKVAEERWSNIVNSLRSSGQDELADRMQNRNEWKAQETVGVEADGIIGDASTGAMRSWLKRKDIAIPENASAIELVELVNRNS